MAKYGGEFKKDFNLFLSSTFGQGPQRNVHLVAGKRYKVDPLNPLGKKHKGRTGVLIGFNPKSCKCEIRFEDTHHVGVVDASNLVAIFMDEP